MDSQQGLLRTQLLQRIRYILEVLRPDPAVVLAFLQVLTRVARHSTQAAFQVAFPHGGKIDISLKTHSTISGGGGGRFKLNHFCCVCSEFV